MMTEAVEILRIAKLLLADEAQVLRETKRFVSEMQKMLDRYHAEKFPRQGIVLKMMKGKRYYRIVAHATFDGEEGSGTSAWAFVDKETGDIFRPAGWKRPAKHPRGSVLDKSSWKRVGPYGPAYMR